MIRDEKPQWQTGQIRIQASDVSSAKLRPSPTDKEKVLFELNDSGEIIEDFWLNGYFIGMPFVLFDVYKD